MPDLVCSADELSSCVGCSKGPTWMTSGDGLPDAPSIAPIQSCTSDKFSEATLAAPFCYDTCARIQRYRIIVHITQQHGRGGRDSSSSHMRTSRLATSSRLQRDQMRRGSTYHDAVDVVH